MDTTTDLRGERATETTTALQRSSDDGVRGAPQAADHCTNETNRGR